MSDEPRDAAGHVLRQYLRTGASSEEQSRRQIQSGMSADQTDLWVGVGRANDTSAQYAGRGTMTGPRLLVILYWIGAAIAIFFISVDAYDHQQRHFIHESNARVHQAWAMPSEIQRLFPDNFRVAQDYQVPISWSKLDKLRARSLKPATFETDICVASIRRQLREAPEVLGEWTVDNAGRCVPKDAEATASRAAAYNREHMLRGLGQVALALLVFLGTPWLLRKAKA